MLFHVLQQYDALPDSKVRNILFFYFLFADFFIVENFRLPYFLVVLIHLTQKVTLKQQLLLLLLLRRMGINLLVIILLLHGLTLHHLLEETNTKLIPVVLLDPHF
jgi:hypothetical protein